MEKHLLLTVSEDTSALYGVRFVGYFFENLQEMKVTLYFTATTPEPALHSTTEHRLAGQQARARQERGAAALEHAKDVLQRHGFQEEHIVVKLAFGSQSKASDIMFEAERGLYDAVVLGRRGVSWLEESMGESVTRQLLEDTLTFPLWICRRPEQNRRNVLLCVDGSASSLRMADHVGFMLADHPSHAITMLTILKEEQQDAAKDIFANCTQVLHENGVNQSRIQSKVLHSNNVANTIMQLAEKDRFAVVATGRTGAGGGLLQRFFMGSASSTLFKQLTGAVLWVCH